MRRHPVLLGLVVVVVLVVGFIALVLVFSRFLVRKPGFVLGDKVAVIEIAGVITNPQTTIDQLVRYREDGGVKAIILRIDSPGGGVGPSQEIYREVMRTKKAKKVVASLGGVAASGGYYVASAADAIVANPGTITGSIGVIMQFSNVEGLMKLIGLKTYTFKSGKHKDLGSPFREPNPGDEAILMEVIETVHDQFVGAVAQGRDMDVARVREIADGRILSGQQAMELGLVDRMGNLQDAIELAAEMGGIRGKPHVVFPKRKRNLLDLFLDRSMAALIERLRITNHQLFYRISPVRCS
jgi:protease-4